MFVNMLPIRLKPRSNTSFNDYLTDTRTTMLDALSAQDVPFDRIVEKLGQQRTPGRHPLFDVSFDYHNIEHHRLHIGGLKGQQIETDPLAVGMDLVITATETTDGIQFLLDYSSDLFDGTTISMPSWNASALIPQRPSAPSASTQRQSTTPGYPGSPELPSPPFTIWCPGRSSNAPRTQQ